MQSAFNKTSAALALLTAATLAAMPPSGVAAQGAAPEVLTNESVVQMVAGKVSTKLILAKIESTPNTAFDVTTEGVVALHRSKVSRDTILAMLKKPSPGSRTEVLTNDRVVSMVSNGVPRDVIIARIQGAKTGFDLTASGLVSLKQSKVPEAVVKEMMGAAAAPSPVAAPAAAPSAPTRPTPPPKAPGAR